MIPFKLFKYIYANEIFYTIIYIIFCSVITMGIYFILYLFVSKDNINMLSVLSIAYTTVFMLYISKSVLYDVIFSKYKNIKITTNLKKISWVFFLKLFIPRIIALVGINLIFDGISYIVFKYYYKSNSVVIDPDDISNIRNTIYFTHFIIEVIVDYYIYNWYLSKHISVSK